MAYELKLDVLRSTLGVPLTFEISRGFVRTLQIHIPWTNLLGQPIEVKIDTVIVVIKVKTDEELREALKGLRATSNPQVEYIARVVTKEGKAHGVRIDV